MLALSAQNNRQKENECAKHMLQITFSGKDRLSQRAKEPLPTKQRGEQAGNRPESADISRLFDVEPSGGLGATAQPLEPAVSRVSAGRTRAAAGSAAPGCPAVSRVLRAEERVGPEGTLRSLVIALL